MSGAGACPRCGASLGGPAPPAACPRCGQPFAAPRRDATLLGPPPAQGLVTPPPSARFPAGAATTPSRPGGRAAPGEAPAPADLPPEVLAALADPARSLGALPPEQARARGLPPGAGRYALLGELGRGGMGVVARAYDASLRRPVAIKMILDPAGAGATRVARFLREASTAARLRHPAIVAVHEVSEHQGRPFIVMDLVEGESLEALVEREGTPPPRRVAELTLALAQALQHAHEAGVVHRDVKPQNVMVDRAGRPHLMDFGLARDATERQQLTQSGQVLGTPSYMAPEQAAGRGDQQGPATDVYALGAVLYRALVGRPPFEADSMVQLAQRIVAEEPEAPRRLNPGVHPDLETIALRCLEKEPARRYASAAALAEDLRRFLAGEPILARPTTAWERARRAAGRHRAAVAAAGVALLLGALFVVGALGWRALDRRARVRAAWAEAAAARDRFADLAGRDPTPYGEAHAAVLGAMRDLDHVLNLAPDHAAARRAKFEVAVRMGELALARRDFGLATTLFAAAEGLGIDDALARARRAAVEEARGEEERRIRRGVEQLLRELEGPAAAPAPEHGAARPRGRAAGPWRLVEAASAVAALSGGRRAGDEVVVDACRAALLDPARPADARVVAGLVLASAPAAREADLDPVAAALPGADPVGQAVAAHVLAATGAPRFAAALRAARERLARRAWGDAAAAPPAAAARPDDGGPRDPDDLGPAPLAPVERDLLAELGRALLIHGDPAGVQAVLEELLAVGHGEFGAAAADFEGTLGPRTRAAYAEAIRRATPLQRLHLLLGLEQEDALEVAGLADALVDLLLAAPEEDRLPLAYARLEVPFPFDALYASAFLVGRERARPSSAAWQAARLLVRAAAGAALARATTTADPWTRGVAALGLGEAGPDPAGRARLAALLADGSPWVRTCAATALARGLEEAGLVPLAAAEAAGDPVAAAVLQGVRAAADVAPGAPLREVFAALRDALPVALGARVLPCGPLGERASPAIGPLDPTRTSAVACVGGQLPVGTREALPPGVALLGRTSRRIRAAALRSDTARAALEEALAGAPPGGRRAQGALRLLAQLEHPRLAALARGALARGGGFFGEVEALRALLACGAPDAAEVLGALRARWTADPALARGLLVETRVRTDDAVIGAAGLLHQALAPCLAALAVAPTPAAARELAAFTGSRWTSDAAFAALDRLGEAGLAALDAPGAPPGQAAYFEGWWALLRRPDPARARRALERALAAGYGAPRAHLLLAWLDLEAAPPDPRRAREHLVAARRAGSPLAAQATFWQGWVALHHLQRPLEAEACWRSLLLDADRGRVPPPAGPLPALEPAGPEAAPAGPWSPEPGAGDPPGPTTPFLQGTERVLALACLGHYLAVERGALAEGWALLAEALERGHDRALGRLLPLLCDLAARSDHAKGYPPLLERAGREPPRDPAWPAWAAYAPALAGRPDEAAAALRPLAAGDDARAATARWLLALLAHGRGDLPGAAAALDAALALAPDDPRLRREAAGLAVARGDLDAALEHARAAAAVDPWLWIAEGVDARARVAELVGRLVAAPPDAARAARRAALLREVVPALPADPAAWAAAWARLRERVRWDADARALRE